MSPSTRVFEHRYYRHRVCYIMKRTVITNKKQKYVRFNCMRVSACIVSYVGLIVYYSSSNCYHRLRSIRRRTTIWNITVTNGRDTPLVHSLRFYYKAEHMLESKFVGGCEEGKQLYYLQHSSKDTNCVCGCCTNLRILPTERGYGRCIISATNTEYYSTRR